MDVSGRRVLITGSTDGLGFAMANALGNAGAHVAISGRSTDKLERACTALTGLPGKALAVPLDVRSESSIQLAVETIVQAWGGVDVLVNNAGIGMRSVNPAFLTDPKPFWEIPAERFRDLIDTNVTGYFLVAQAVVPQFIRQGRGRIVNISVNHETMTRKGFIPYGPSRAATESLSHIMAQDLAGFGIAVNLLLPGGATLTGMVPEGIPDSVRARMLPADVMAEPIVFLCSSEADGVHDERIVAKDFAAWRSEYRSRKAG